MGNNKAVRNVGVTILHALLPVIYNTRVEGIERLDMNFSGLIAFKHRSNMDVPFLVHAVPKFIHFPAKKGVFRVPILGKLLELGGGYPIIRQSDQGYRFMHPLNISTYMSLFELLRAGEWCAYAPEGTRVPYGVGEDIFSSFLTNATKNNVPTYLAGIQYSKGIAWLPFTTVTIRFERYRLNDGHDKAEAAQGIRQGLARLSGLGGLERKVRG